MAITDATIEYVAALAKLDLTDEEKERAKVDLGNIIGYVDTMNRLDTTGIEPMSHVFAYNNVFREDVVTNGPDRDNILANAPEEKDGGFKVPRTVE
ncbi:MAG: Asp-tRNA(Asn)/Glu-tRNA(Gln) amidotransferase subunit GatC [Coprococcus sp.]